MRNTTVTSRDFNQSASKVRAAATKRPIIITERGVPSHVILSYSEYESLTGGKRSAIDLLAMEPSSDATFDFDPPKLDYAPRVK